MVTVEIGTTITSEVVEALELHPMPVVLITQYTYAVPTNAVIGVRVAALPEAIPPTFELIGLVNH